MLTAFDTSVLLSPANVAKTAADRVQLEFPDEFVWAHVALAFPYTIMTGDRVLAIGKDGDWYVIGVLKGSGPTTLTVPGDLKFAAPKGRIELMAGKGVRIKSPSVRIIAQSLETFADSVFESFAEATRWVRETFQLRVGRFRARVNAEYDLKATSIVERADEDVKIDGRKIHLG